MFFCCCCSGVSLTAAGRRDDDPLKAAREAHEARNYNQAILLTAEVMKRYPDRFDEAQSLINAIRAAKAKYNRTFAELIEVYQNAMEVQDEAGLLNAYTLIKELEELDPFPNEETAEGLARAREATGNVFNRIRHANIMDQALELIIAGSYFEAVDTYLQGFDLALDIFRDKSYGAEAQAEAARLRDLAREQANEFVRRRETLAVRGAFIDELTADTNPQEMAGALADFEEAYIALSRLRWEIQASLQGLEVLRLLILNEYAAAGEDEIYHLAYLILLHRGRSMVEDEFGLQEGILGAVDGRWETGARELTDRLGMLLDQRYTGAGELFGAESFTEAATAFENDCCCRSTAGRSRRVVARAGWPRNPRLRLKRQRRRSPLESFLPICSTSGISKSLP